MHNLNWSTLSATALGAFVAVMPAPVLAQSAQPPRSAAAAEDDTSLSEIIVTAQRREQKAQDVPIAITSFSADQMAKVGLSSSTDLAGLIPGLASNPTALRGSLYLRGVGNNSNNTSPAVLTYIDGVYQTFSPPIDDYSDIEQIEVAKGPQGTLFGRNATGGIIQITTVDPFNRQGVNAQIGYANFDTLSATLTGSAILSENLAASISGFYNNQRDGWGINRFDGSDVFKAKRYGIRAKLVAKLDETFTATLVGDYADSRSQVGATNGPALGTRLYNAATGQTFSLPGRFDLDHDADPFGHTKVGGVALTLDKEVGDVRLLSISSYRNSREKLLVDQDATSVPFFSTGVRVPRETFTQEFQISGKSSTFNWVAGLYYYYLSEKPELSFGGLFPTLTPPFLTAPGVPYVIRTRPVTNAYAAYAQGTIAVLPETNLTLGARYTIEKKVMAGFTTGSPILSPGSAGSASETFRKPTFRVSIDHRFSPELLAYISYNRGFNAGFFNASSVVGFSEAVNPPVDPEKIDAYEIGLKSDWLNRRLQINVAAFLYDYSNLQQQAYRFGQLFTINAASARIKGVDLDVVARPWRDLTLSVGASYLPTRYNSYPEAPAYEFLPSGEFVTIGSRDAKGKDLVQAPRYSVQATASYRLRTAIGSFDTTAGLNYRSRMYNDPQNDFPIPARTLINLTEQWTSNDERTTITAWVKNLTNKDYDISVTPVTPVGLIGTPGAPRTYGLTLGRRF